MPGKVLHVSAPDGRGEIRLTVLTEDEWGACGRRTFRIGERAYAELGEPGADDLLDDEGLSLLAEKEGEGQALKKAVNLLSYGDNSAAGLYRKLRRHGYNRESAETAVGRMVEKGYIREEEQAYRLAVSCATHKLWGRRRILSALREKGYAAALVGKAIDRAVEEGEIDFAANAEALVLRRLGEHPDPNERRTLLYRYGY